MALGEGCIEGGMAREGIEEDETVAEILHEGEAEAVYVGCPHAAEVKILSPLGMSITLSIEDMELLHT